MEKYSEKVDDYLSGILTAQQESTFLNEISGNEILLKELALHEGIRATFRDEGFVNLRNKLKQGREEINRVPLYISLYQKTVDHYIFGVAATIALFIVSGLLYLFLNGQIAPEQIAQEYYQPANSIQDVRTFEKTEITGVQEAFNMYNSGNYAKSLELFLLIDNKVISNFYAGICYFELNEFTKAGQSFELVLQHNHNLFLDQAEWYLALTYLKLTQVNKAKEILEKIASSESTYSTGSHEILNKLD